MNNSSGQTTVDSGGVSTWRRDLLWLALILSVWFGLFLGSRPLSNPDEGRYTEIPREMAAGNDYVTPRLNGVKYFEKPPLLYWLTAIAIEAGGVNEWTARFWVAALAVFGGLVTYAGARALFGRAAGWWAAIALSTMLMYYVLSRVVILDMPVSVFIAAALFAFLCGVRETQNPRRRRWLFWAFYAGMALAVLSKGLVGFLLPCTVAFAWLLVFNQWKRLRPCHPFTGALVLLAIAAPWHVLAARANHDFAEFYFVHEHWERFTSTVHGRDEPWWFFAPVLLAGIFPWIVFAGQTALGTLRGGWRAWRASADEWFLVVWAVVIFLFFSKSQSKLPPYILPVFPALAALLGKWLADAWRERGSAGLRGGLVAFAAVAAALGIAVLAWPVPAKYDDDFSNLAAWRAGLAAVFLGGAGAVIVFLARGAARRALAAMVACTALFFAAVNFLGETFDTRSTKSVSLALRARAAPSDAVYSIGEYYQDIAPYAGREVSVVDYLGELAFGVGAEPEKTASRFIDRAEFARRWRSGGRAYAIVQKRDAADYFAALPGTVVAENTRYLLLVNEPAKP